MDTKAIEQIINLAEARDLDELEVEEKGTRIRVVRRSARVVSGPAMAPPAATGHPAPGGETDIPDGLSAVRSPTVGIYLAPDNDDGPGLPLVGDRVEPGTVLGYAEAMKMRTEITADTGGEIVEVLVTDQQPVQFNAPLFLLRPDAR